MRPPPPLLSSLAAAVLLAACEDTISVGDATDTRNQGEDVALAQLALKMKGTWYTNFPDLLEMSTRFTPYEGRRGGHFSVSCTSDTCPVGELFTSVFGEPAPVEGTGQANRFAEGEYQLVELLSDADEDWELGIRAKCVMIPDAPAPTFAMAPSPSFTMEIELRPEDDVLRVSMNDSSFDYTRDPN